MKYLPAVAIAVSVGAAVIYATYLTKDPVCLLGLGAMVLAYLATPFHNNES